MWYSPESEILSSSAPPAHCALGACTVAAPLPNVHRRMPSERRSLRKSTARRQVTLEQLAWSKTASHSPKQQMEVRNPNGNPAIEDRRWPITSNGDFDQQYAKSQPAVLNFPLGLQSTHSQCKDRPSEQQIVVHAHNAHASRSGDLLQRAVLSFPLQAAPPETSDSGSECLTRKWNAQESESTCCR